MKPEMERRLFERPGSARREAPEPFSLFRLFDAPFNPGTIKDFNGKTWGDVVLGDTTRDDFKRRYKTKGGHFVRTEALILNLTEEAPWEAQALTDGTKGDAVVTGFYLSFKGRGQLLERVVVPDGPATTYYAKQRYSDWYVAAYPGQGIALMVVNDDGPRVPYALLTTSSRLKRVLDPMTQDVTPVSTISQQFDSLDRNVMVGTVTVDVSGKEVPDAYKSIAVVYFQQQVPRDLKTDTLRYVKGANGTLDIDFDVSIRDNDSSNRVTARGDFTGSNGRGKIAVSARGDYDLDKKKDRARRDINDAVDRAYGEMIEDLKRQVSQAVNKQKPPSPADLRAAAFVNLFNDPTK